MTLVLAETRREFAVQTADSRLTKNINGEIIEHDPNANKIIVFSCRDAIATLGFAGSAYIGFTPTDEWLSRILWDGQPVFRGPDGERPAFLSCGGRILNFDVGTTVFSMIKSMKSVLGRNMSLYLIVAGFQVDRRLGWRPFGVTVAKPKGTTEIRMRRARRHFAENGETNFQSAGLTLATDVQSQLTGRIAPMRDPNEVVNEFVAATRRMSAETDLVGPDVISVVLCNPLLGRGWSQFHAHQPILRRSYGELYSVSLSPWVISDQRRTAPAYRIGLTPEPLKTNYLFLPLGAPPAQDGTALLCSSIPRPPRPR